jgi:exopolysaccharide production protein ExoZ
MHLKSIQMLRGLAALLVIYTHSISQMGIFAIGWQQRTPARISLGTFGVDLFFVISGFIIYLSAGQLSGRQASLSFLWHRFRRINPAYYAAVLVTVITWIPSFLHHSRPPITGYQLLSWTIPLPFPGDPARALSQAWSLYFEWFFYLLFFLLILIRAQKKAALLCLLLGSLALLGWLLQNYLTGLLLFYTDPLMLEFLLGVGIGVVYRKASPNKTTALCLLLPGIALGLVLMLTGYVDYQAVLPPPATVRYLHAFYWGSAAALVVAGCVFLEKSNAFTPRHQNFGPELRQGFARLLLLLGDASYSLYLFHMIVFGWIAAFYLRVGFFLNPDLAIPVHAAIAVAGSLLFYKVVESPLLRWLKRYDPLRSTPPRPAKP